MFKSILVAFDGSQHAENALRTGISLAQNSGNACHITVLYVQHSLASYVRLSPLGVEQLDFDKFLRDDAERLRKQIVEITSKTDVQTFIQFKMGDPANEICKFSKENGYDLIVMGSRGLGTMVELAIGSVSHKVIQHATQPVLIVK